MPKLRHLALYTADPKATAEFYKRVFDMQEVGQNRSAFADEIIFLSDGTLMVALLHFKTAETAAKMGGSMELGLNHFGFWVEDLAETRRRLRELEAENTYTNDPAANTLFVEEKWRGPDGVAFDINDKGWPGALSPRAEELQGDRPKIRHLAFHTANVEKAADFYKRVFDMLEVGRNTTATSEGIYLSDGTLNVTILQATVPLSEFAKYSGSTALGMSHFGFLVQDVEEIQRRLRDVGAVHIDEQLAGLVHAEDKWRGPDGVLFDVTDQGWTGARPLGETEMKPGAHRKNRQYGDAKLAER